MPFAEFMHQALYAPGLGYYTSSQIQIGQSGDFTTAPELTPLFGATLANQIHEVANGLNKPILFEFGAGTGKLCIDILSRLEQLDSLPDKYCILEVSGYLKQLQQQRIKEAIPHLLAKIQWLDALPEQPFEGIIIANEVLDAIPVNRFMLDNNELLESYITLNQHNELIEVFKPSNNEKLDNAVNQLEISTHPYQSEVNLFVNDWIACCYAMLKKGLVLLIDYGFPQHEYYHHDRNTGTLMCHHQQKTHPNPLIHVGEQDITAHVNFTLVAHAAVDAGFEVSGYTNQASFLLANGLLSLVDKNEKERLNQIQTIKILTQHHEMGELFKIMALTKALESELTGFYLSDKRASL